MVASNPPMQPPASSRAFPALSLLVALTLSTAPLSGGTKAPAGTNTVLSVTEDTPVMISPVDFGFKDTGDVPPDKFTNIVLSSLPPPNRGTLKVNGVNATVNQVVRATPTTNAWVKLPGQARYAQQGGLASSNDGKRLVISVENPSATRQLSTSVDGGMTWQTRLTGSKLHQVACSGDGLTIATVENNGILRTSVDGGATWTARTATNASWTGIAMSDNGTIMVACQQNGSLYTSTDSGATWTARDSAREWRSVACSASGSTMVACAYLGKIYTSTDSGATWTARDSDRGWSQVGISANGTRMVAGQGNAAIYQSSDSGVTWTIGTRGGYCSAVSMSDDGTRLIMADAAAGRLYTSADSGATWVETATNVPPAGYSNMPILVVPDGSRLLSYSTTSSDETSGLYVSQPVITFEPALNNFIDSAFSFNVEDDGSANNRDLTSNTVTFAMQPVNDAPQVVTPIPDQTVAEGSPLTYSFPITSITDPDANALTLSATLAGGAPLPAWLKFTGSSRTFAGKPTDADVGTLTVEVTATENTPAALKVTDRFDIVVTNTDYPPEGTTRALLIPANQAYSFTAADFGFSDLLDAPFPHPFTRVKITAPMPAAGTLLVNGTPVAADSFVSMRPGIAGANWAERTMVYANNGIATSRDGSRAVSVQKDYEPQTTTDRGVNWSYPQDASINWTNLAGSGDLTHLVGTVYGAKLRVSNNSGSTWTERGTVQTWKAAAVSANGSRMVAVTGDRSYPSYRYFGSIFTSTDSGVTWVERTGYPSQSFTSVACSADGMRIVAVADNRTDESDNSVSGQMVISTDGGATWTVRETPRSWWDVASSDNGRTLIACVSGTSLLYVSTDGGVTWTTRGSVHKWTSVASSADGKRLFAGDFENGQVHGSEDGGLTWTPSGPSRNWLNLACSADGSTLYGQTFSYIQVGTADPAPDLTFTPVTGATGSNYAKLTFQVEDSGAAGSNLDLSANVLTLNIAPINHPPTLASPRPDVAVNEDGQLLIQLPAGMFADSDKGQVLTFTASQSDDSPLPAWLQFNPATGIFSGSPKDADVGLLEVKLKATDNGVPAMSASDTFSITVFNVDYPPQGRDRTLTTTEGTEFEITDSDFGFSDVGDPAPHYFTRVKITELPEGGYLSDYFDGQIEVGDYVTIPIFRLRFYPNPANRSTPHGRIGFQVEDSGSSPNNLDPTPNYLTLNLNLNPSVISMEQEGTPLTSGDSTVDFGTRYLGSGPAILKSFIIKNTGTGALVLNSVVVDGPQADDFIINFMPISPVMPSNQSFFQIRFNPTSQGTRTATLHILSSDATQPAFDVELTGVAQGLPGVLVVDETGTPQNPTTVLDFGRIAVNKPFKREVTVINNGTSPLYLMDTVIVGTDSADFSIPSPLPTFVLAPGSRMPLSITLNSATSGLKQASINLITSATHVTFGAAGLVQASENPEIDVQFPMGVPLADNTGSTDFGDVDAGGVQSLTGRIENLGTLPLKGFSVTIAGDHKQDFSVDLDASEELSGGMAMPFTVYFSPTAGGSRSAVIRIASNDADESPFDILVSGTGHMPEIVVEQPAGTLVADGKGTVDFGTHNTGTIQARTFTLRNTGDGFLSLRSPSIVIDGPNAADFFLAPPMPSGAVAPGGNQTFIISFFPRAMGTRTAYLHVLSNDGDEGAYDIKLTGKANGPEINVEVLKAALTSTVSTVDYGRVLNGNIAGRVFTLKNTGNANLEIQDLSVTGAAEFSLAGSNTFPMTLAAGATRTFTVNFAPTALQDYTGTVAFLSNDGDEMPFFIDLSGTGVDQLSPSFTSPPQPQIVAAGQNAVFTAAYTPATGVSLLWSKGTGMKYTDIKTATSATLTLPAVKLTDAASLYRLRLTQTSNKAFVDSQPVALSVVDRTASRANKPENGSVTFTVNAATTGDLRYLWRKDGGDLPADSRFTGGLTNSLTITGLELPDAGTYTCEVSGPGGTLTGGDNVLTIFNAAPAFQSNPLSLPGGIVSGDYSQLIPLAPGSGIPTTWTAANLPKGLTIDSVTGRVYGKPTVASGASPFSFTVTGVNSLGSATSTVNLAVQPFPTDLAGSYLVLIDRGPVNNELGGRIDLVISGTGGVTGTLLLGKDKAIKLPASFINTSPNSTQASLFIRVPRTGLPTVNIDLGLDAARKRLFRGQVTAPSFTASTANGWKNTWSTGNPSENYDGTYNIALQIAGLTPGVPILPHGHGYSSFKVGLKGEGITTAGKLPDGDSFTSSTFLGPDGDLAFFAPLPSGGSLIGVTGILPGTAPSYDDNAIAKGDLTWDRPSNTNLKAAVYKDGFYPASLIVTGGLYKVTGNVVMNRVAGPEGAYLSFREAGLNTPNRANRYLPLAAGASLNIPAQSNQGTSIKLDRNTGAFSGTFNLIDVHPVTPSAPRILRSESFQGLIIPTANGHVGRGWFLLPQLPTDVFPPLPVLPELSGAVQID